MRNGSKFIAFVFAYTFVWGSYVIPEGVSPVLGK